jgi:hypothetical protein
MAVETAVNNLPESLADLFELTVRDGMEDEIIAAGGAVQLKSVMEGNLLDEGGQLRALKALRNLAVASDSRRQRLMDAGKGILQPR